MAASVRCSGTALRRRRGCGCAAPDAPGKASNRGLARPAGCSAVKRPARPRRRRSPGGTSLGVGVRQRDHLGAVRNPSLRPLAFIASSPTRQRGSAAAVSRPGRCRRRCWAARAAPRAGSASVTSAAAGAVGLADDRGHRHPSAQGFTITACRASPCRDRQRRHPALLRATLPVLAAHGLDQHTTSAVVTSRAGRLPSFADHAVDMLPALLPPCWLPASETPSPCSRRSVVFEAWLPLIQSSCCRSRATSLASALAQHRRHAAGPASAKRRGTGLASIRAPCRRGEGSTHAAVPPPTG